jgi:hypothetical protein
VCQAAGAPAIGLRSYDFRLRAELTAQERADNIARWVSLTGEKIGASCTNSSKPGPKGAIRAAERELGVEHTEAARSIKIASIAPEAKHAARDAGLDRTGAGFAYWHVWQTAPLSHFPPLALPELRSCASALAQPSRVSGWRRVHSRSCAATSG